MDTQPVAKRGRGRPRKSGEPTAPVEPKTPKRARGRPPKPDEGSDGPPKKRVRDENEVPVPDDIVSTFSPEVVEVLARLEDHTFSKPLKKCFLGIVRDVIKVTQGAFAVSEH